LKVEFLLEREKLIIRVLLESGKELKEVSVVALSSSHLNYWNPERN